MNRIFKIGLIHKKVTKNPVEGLATSTKTAYKAIKMTPAQTLDPAFCDGEHAALHSGVRCSSDGAPKLGSALAPMGGHPLGRAEDQDRQVVEEDGR
jgi:hypothetical protein